MQMKTLAIFAAAVGFAACARGETDTAEPDAFLEYIEATGSQYIDTGVNAETGLKAQIDFAWAAGFDEKSDWSLLDATINNTDSNKRTRFQMCHMFQKKPYFGYGKQRGNPSGAVDFVGGQRCEIITDMTDTNSLELVARTCPERRKDIQRRRPGDVQDERCRQPQSQSFRVRL